MDVFRISRRGVISLTLAALSYLLYRIAAHNGWIIVTRGARRVARGIRPASRNPSQELSLLVVGDTGLDSPQRHRVVGMMERVAATIAPDAVVMLGDNFYENGVQSLTDPRFEHDFERLFPPQAFACPFYPALGNHDYQGNPLAQVEYTQRSPRWRMQHTYYKVRLGTPHETLDLFVTDTTPIHESLPGFESQLQWLDKELSASESPWKIVVGHHPCLSGGEHGASDPVKEHLGPLLRRHRVALYLSGHEHDLQLIDSGHGWKQLIAGSSSKLRSTSWTDDSEFASATPGFAWLFLRDGQLSVSFFNDRDRLFTTTLSSHFPRDLRLVATAFASD